MATLRPTVYSRGSAAAIVLVDLDAPKENGSTFCSTPTGYPLPDHQPFDPGLLRWEENPPKPSRGEPRSGTIFVRDLGHPRYRLQSALLVAVEVDGPHVVAFSHDLDAFGWGDGEGEAVADFKAAVCELFDALREDRATLGPHPQTVLRYLERVIAEDA